MKYSFRWFGPNDPTNLNQIRQVGANHIVTSLTDIQYGEKWTNGAIQKRKKIIEKINFKNQLKLHWSVVESLPVHNDIKIRAGKYQYYIDQYKNSLKNLANNNIKTVCYNFMPIVDWIRTDLNYKLSDGSIALKYNHFHMCIFDKIIAQIRFTMRSYSNQAPPRERLLENCKQKYASAFNPVSSIFQLNSLVNESQRFIKILQSEKFYNQQKMISQTLGSDRS